MSKEINEKDVVEYMQIVAKQTNEIVKKALIEEVPQTEPWPSKGMRYAIMKTANDLFEKWLRENNGGKLQDHFEPKQACNICKHINVDYDEYPCNECKHNPHLQTDK